MDKKEINISFMEGLPLFLVNIVEAVLLLDEVNMAKANKGKSIIVFKTGNKSNKYELPINIKDADLYLDVKKKVNKQAYRIRKRLGFYN